MSENLNGVMNGSMKNLKDMIDVNAVVGNPITMPDGTTLIPVSKVTFGYASAGSDFGKDPSAKNFGGGTGGGVTIQPLGFLVVKDGDVKLINISETHGAADRIVSMVPEVIDKVNGVLSKDKKAPAAPAAE